MNTFVPLTGAAACPCLSHARSWALLLLLLLLLLHQLWPY
jgi:hypothetical protein